MIIYIFQNKSLMLVVKLNIKWIDFGLNYMQQCKLFLVFWKCRVFEIIKSFYKKLGLRLVKNL